MSTPTSEQELQNLECILLPPGEKLGEQACVWPLRSAPQHSLSAGHCSFVVLVLVMAVLAVLAATATASVAAAVASRCVDASLEEGISGRGKASGGALGFGTLSSGG